MDIKVLGPGCPNCKKLEQATLDVVANMGIDAKISKVTDIMEIMSYGVMTTPALVVDGKVIMKGKLPSKDELTKLFTPFL